MNLTPDDVEIIYEDDNLIAINKPHGLLVHRSRIAADALQFALQLLRDKVGYKVHPIHRIDRKTSGVLLFSKNKEALYDVHKLFQEQKITKEYLAIVRGYTPDFGTIDYPLENGKGKKGAITNYETIEQFEIDLPDGRFQTSRYSLVKAMPLQGRYHQIRKHFAHISHPILGDRPHGCNKQNRLWKVNFSMLTMMLHANAVSFTYHNQRIEIKAPMSEQFKSVLSILNGYRLKA